MVEQKPTPEDSFRSSLQDVIAVADKLAMHCKTVEEMVGMAQLALENDGQLRFLMALVTGKK